MSIHLDKGKPRTLAYAAHLRSDLKLLEVTEELLAELQEKGCVVVGTNMLQVTLGGILPSTHFI